MASVEDARYRLQLAEGFLREAREDLELRRWRSTVDNSQLAVENAAKSVLAVLGPVGRTHDLVMPLRRALEDQRFPRSVSPHVERLAIIAGELGWDVHIASDYGDEIGHHTPWELFDDGDAEGALTLAEEAVALTWNVVNATLGP